ncbi:FecR family protein [Desertivirga brevis]|uniref:FecR family protein n=1 Tax=Desertivirga brevis TaxID=2810310 RepID=UPI001A97784A|nr:FecR family protein [Pedobacter sp. SYSU D00873]
MRTIAPERKVRSISFWIRIAACLGIGTTLLGIIGYQHLYRAQTSANQVSYETVTTANKQLRKLILPDSTEVWLNAKSKIRITQPFVAAGSRSVYLDEGEAYFKVKRDVSHPFYVVTGPLRTRVLGTQFNIRAYQPKKTYQVAVVSGSVAVDKIDATGAFAPMVKQMTKGEVFHVTSQNIATHARDQDTELMSAWRQGQLSYLKGVTLSDLAAEIGRKHDLQVAVERAELDKSTYTIRLKQASLDEQLRQLVVTTGITYRLNDKQLIIYPQNYH